MTSTASSTRPRLHAMPLDPGPPPGGPIGGAPGELVRRLTHRDRVAAFAGGWAWGAVVTCDPVLVAPAGADPFAVLGAVPRLPADPARPGAVGGGWFGFIDHAPPESRPGAVLAWYRDVLRHDGERWWFEALVAGGEWPVDLPVHSDVASAEQRLAELRADLAGPAPRRAARLEVLRWPDRDAHLAAVERCVTEIRRGEIFQANIATGLDVRLHGDVHEAWARLAGSAPPARAALVDGPERAAVSASPELFLHRARGEIATAPIKGTRPRTGDPEGDARERRRLAVSVKDAAENVMIVDLMRNDLARVAVPGGVRVGRLLEVEPHPGVWHLVSRVHATLRDDVTDRDLLAAAFPPGSVTGAPKVRACEVIAECEDRERGLFTGAVGGVSPLAGLELNVAIRTLDLGAAGPDGARHGRLGVGGGITVDSDPAEEYDECLTKAAPVLAALDGPPRPPAPAVTRPADRAAGLFETVACTDGVADRVGEHAARLRRSYLAVTGTVLTAPVEAAAARAAAARTGHGRMRIEADVRDPSRVDVRVAHWPGPVPLEDQPGLVVVVRRGTDGTELTRTPASATAGAGTASECHKFADRRWLDDHEAATGPDRTPLLADPAGNLLESTRSAVAAVHRGRLWVPPLDGRILPGTGRRAVLDLLGPSAVRIAPLPVGELPGVDGLFLVNALRGIQWVREVHDGSGLLARWAAPDPLIHRLAEGLRGTVRHR
ncbi:chorismate-binding protein [Pseudonocardia parietis]|uniref:Para-aminobenzoate synthetase/4-amino-4-deoxychorismate lyase n=1 Tax=Pseudonocardia parietis TaxID=570936 RepID=A0ABS4VMT4_9PSEU|nr:chorismate-binding protein [Pseudonocardia parietis]MBP2365242.1 para-aminobenzoate synthetase/4-amino-4-deoxychorismate lyase [Pseudonocardia parietis]